MCPRMGLWYLCQSACREHGLRVKAMMDFRVWRLGLQITDIPRGEELRCSWPTDTFAQTSLGGSSKGGSEWGEPTPVTMCKPMTGLPFLLLGHHSD